MKLIATFAATLFLGATTALACNGSCDNLEIKPLSEIKKVEQQFTPKPNQEVETAQFLAYSFICRRGYWYCVMPYSGPIGYSCRATFECGGWFGVWSDY